MPIREMGSAALVSLALLIAFAGDAAASCRKMANEDMLEYFCEGGHLADLTAIPETTEKLRITRMPLRRITADTFSRFGGNLWVLGCSHCEITDIDADAFRRLVNLQQLSLDSNRLTTVRASWFEGLDSLTYVDLNYNDISDIEDGVYRNLPGLVDFRISGNRLRCLNLDEMSRLRELKRMFLSENSGFACPHAVSKFLENHGVAFEQDPEWRMLASDRIDVHVPPSLAEEDNETMPAYHERFHPDRRRPPPEESEGPYATRDKTIYPDHSGHRPRHRRPPTTTVRPTTKLPLPRVEPIYPATDTRPSYVPSESLSQVIPYPYSTPEMPRAPPPEDIRMSGTDGSSRTDDILTYPPYIPTHETTPYWSYPTPERPRTSVTSVPLSEDTRMSGADWPPQTERVATYPPYIPTHETMPYPLYPTERSRVGSKFSEDETIEESGRSPQVGNTITYPLYITSDDLEGTPHGSIQMTRPLSGDSDMVTLRTWSTDDHSIEPDDPSWTQDRGSHEQFRHPAGGSDRSPSWSTNTPDPRKTPYYGHDPREMIVEGPSSRIDNDVSVATDRSRAETTPPDMHYVRPSPHSPPELVHSSSTDEFYQTPHYKTTVAVPPLQDYRDGDGATGVRAMETTTTDKPLPECPENSATATRPVTVLVTLVVVTVFGHVVVERF